VYNSYIWVVRLDMEDLHVFEKSDGFVDMVSKKPNIA
jgi:hypothetical protein